MTTKKILKSRSIFTATSSEFLAGFVVIDDGVITGVYPEKAFQAFPKADYTITDYGDQSITPGFVDAHQHVYLSALMYSGQLKAVDNTSAKQVVLSLKRQMPVPNAKTADWLVGKGWYAPSWQEPTLPNAGLIDALIPDVPVAIVAADLHTLWVNTKGFKQLFKSLDVSTNPDVVTTFTGQPTGVIKEATAMSCLSQILSRSHAEKASVIAPYLTHLASLGITAISDMSVLPAITATGLDDQIYPASYALIAERKKLPVRVNLFPFFKRDMQQLKKMKYRYNRGLLRIAGGKLFFDGVTSSHTAWTKAPYEETQSCGQPDMPPAVMRQLIFTAQREQWPLRIHTIGDQATFTALTYFKAAKKTYGPLVKGTHTLEHLEMMDDENLHLFQKTGVLASVQPSHPLMDFATIHVDVGKREGAMWPLKTYVDLGIPLAFGTDSPVVATISPLTTIYYAMTRQTLTGSPPGGWYSQHRLSLAESLIATTKGGARACNLQDVGTLAAGMQADVVVLDCDLRHASAKEVLQAAVVKTYVAGVCTFEK